MGDIALLNENVPTRRINLLGQFIQFAFVGIRKGDAAGIADPGYALPACGLLWDGCLAKGP